MNDIEGRAVEQNEKPKKEKPANGWTGVVSLGMMCATILGVAWIIWGR